MVQLGMVSYKEKMKNAKTPFLNIGPEKSAQVSILAELKGFTYAVEHYAPEAWYKTALCTFDTGDCYPCEQQERGWNQRIKVYVPVLHRGQFKIFGAGMGTNSVIHSLQDYYREHGTIMDTEFIISRNGSGKRSKYFATAVDNSTPIAYNGDIGINKTLHSIEYSKQAEYYK